MSEQSQPILHAYASVNHDRLLHQGLFRNRNFILLWAGNVVSALGDRIHMMVMLALLGQLIGEHHGIADYKPGTMESAQLTIMMLLPYLLFSPIMGVLADRYPRRMLMLISDLCRVILILVARSLFLKEQGQVTNSGSMLGHDFYVLYSLLLGAEFVQTIFASCFTPARNALLPQLVHPTLLLRANSMTTAAGTIASLLGFIAGGFLIAYDKNLHIALYVDAGTYLISALCMAGLSLKGVTQHKSLTTGPWLEFKLGFNYLKHHKKVWQITVLLMLYWSCGAIILSGLTGIVTRYYNLKLEYYSYFMAVIGLGMVFGAGSMSLFKRGIPKEWGIAWSMLGVGAFLALFTMMGSWQWGLVWVTLAAASGSVLLVSLETLLQRIVPDFVRGRVMGVKELITNSGMIGLTIPLALSNDIDSVIFLILKILSGLVVLVGLFLLIYYYRHRPAQLSIPGSIFLRVVRGIMSFWHRYRRVGPCRIPLHGPVIVVANHTSGLDAAILQLSSPNRIIHFMMAKEYFEIWGLHWLFTAFGAIPVNRNGNEISSVRTALRALQEGKVLGLFPEGKISLDGQLQEGKTGVAALAQLSGAPVVPAYISGTILHKSVKSDVLHRAHLRIAYGKPIYFPKTTPSTDSISKSQRNSEQLQKFTDQIMHAIAQLSAQAQSE